MAKENEKINPDQITDQITDTEETERLDGLKAALSKEPVPEALTPEAIQKQLGGAQQKTGAGRIQKWALMAAGLLLCVVLVGVYVVQNTGGQKKTDTDSLYADADSSTEETQTETAAASDYTALYDILISQNQVQTSYSGGTLYGGTTDVAMAVEEDAAAADIGSTSTTTGDYAGTNLQTAGVDEADTIKTDGTFLFLLGEDEPTLRVVRADGGTLTLTDELTFAAESDDETVYLCEFYVADGILTVFAQYSQTEYYTDGDDGYEMCGSDDCTVINTRDTVTAYTYRVEDDGTLTALGSRTQDGSYNTSRKVGHTVYLFTSYYPFVEHLTEEVPEEFVPHVNGTLLSAESISIRDTSYYEYEGGIEAQYSWYIVASAFSDETPQETLDEMAVFTHDYGDSLYAGTQALYFLQDQYVKTNKPDIWVEQVSLLKYAYADGKFTAQGETALSGRLNDTFSLYENGDYLYVVTTQSDELTDWEETNHLYVLDGALNVTGTIDNIAEGETIQSARFVGTTGYFVTYENTDPLFSVDLSDPYAPVITGELTLPGFSSYLHFYSDTLLLGLGEETSSDGSFESYKMAMYDISDPANVQEQTKLLLDDVPDAGDITYCEAMYGTNYKELLIDTEKNLIGFSVENYDGERYHQGHYLLFSYEDGTFVNKLYFDMEAVCIAASETRADTGTTDAETSAATEGASAATEGSSAAYEGDAVADTDVIYGDVTYVESVRGLYIGDTFYLCAWYDGGKTICCICAFDMTNDYAQTGTLQLLSE